MIILYNGIIRTMSESRPVAQAVAIEGGKIVAVGSDEEILVLRKTRVGKSTPRDSSDVKYAYHDSGVEAIDLRGRLALPGFHDSHAHLAATGAFARKLNLSGISRDVDMISRIREYLHNEKKKPGEWVEAVGLDDSKFREAPSRILLDKISQTHPIVIARHCNHVAYVNSCALDMIKRRGGGCDKRERQGLGLNELAGVFHESSMDMIYDLLPRATKEDIKANIIAASEGMLRRGITTVHSNDMSIADLPDSIDEYIDGASGGGRLGMDCFAANDAARNDGGKNGGGRQDAAPTGYGEGRDGIAVQERGDRESMYEAFAELGERAPIRVYEITVINSLADAKKFVGIYKRLYESPYYTNRCVKVLLDGSLGARTAYLLRRYSDSDEKNGSDGYFGISHFKRDELDEMIRYIDEAGVQFAFHAIGDAALEQVLVGMKSQRAPGRNRHRIIHCQIGSPDQYRRIKELGLCVDAQPAFYRSDAPILLDRLGEERTLSSYAWGTLHRLGIPMGFGSDSPIEPFDPLWGIYCAVSRDSQGALDTYGRLRNERMGVADACYCYTAGAARLAFQERVSGRIETGMNADIVVLDRDIFTAPIDEIPAAKPDITIVNGIVHNYE